MTVTLQYLFLSSFFLMLVQSVALIVKLKTALRARSRIATYCILGWGQSVHYAPLPLASYITHCSPSVCLSVPNGTVIPVRKVPKTSNLAKIFFLAPVTDKLIFGRKDQRSRSYGPAEISNFIDADLASAKDRVVFVRGKPGNFTLTGSDLPSHWFV